MEKDDTMRFREPIEFQDIIKIVKENVDEGVSYCIYSKISDSNYLKLDTICYIDDYPEITDEDEEIFSEFAVHNSLDLLFREELVQDVVHNVLRQKAAATDEEILKAILYYDDKDDFMDFKVSGK